MQIPGASSVALTLVAGISGVLWQSQLAERAATQAVAEASRANVTKNFLLNLLIANDTRIPAARKRKEIPAGELLRHGIDRLDTEFPDSPSSRMELLDLGATIYRYWGEDEESLRLRERRARIAESLHGPDHPIVIDFLIRKAISATDRPDLPLVESLLAEARRRIDRADLENSEVGAMWWYAHYFSLSPAPEFSAQRIEELLKLIPLADRFSADPMIGIIARLNLSTQYRNVDRHEDSAAVAGEAVSLLQGAARIDQRSRYLSVAYMNMANADEIRGDLDAAEKIWQTASSVQVDAYERLPDSSAFGAAQYAWFLHRRGDPVGAHRILESLHEAVEADAEDEVRLFVRQVEASCLANEGRLEQALPKLRQLDRELESQPGYAFPEFRRVLGDVLDRSGYTEQAETALRLALAESLEQTHPGAQGRVLARERWARYLLDRGDLQAATREFDAVIQENRPPDRSPAALALAGLARVASRSGDSSAAQGYSQRAIDELRSTPSLYDIRIWAYLWKVRGEAFEDEGQNPDEARRWFEKAEESVRSFGSAF